MTSENETPKSGLGSKPLAEGSVATDQTGDKPDMIANKANGLGVDDPSPNIDAPIQRHIGQKLKDSYEDLVNQPVPDRFRQLLEELERQERQK
jgi:hypothetical protein